MPVFKCKMCGGNIEFNPGESIGTCDSCGSVQTLPKGNDDIITNLFNRANNLRIKAEFDKAAEIYEKIVDEDNTNAEAHWGLVLCKYGIEYVEDPATHKRIPTCHRAQYESIMTDADYVAALENSDTTQQGVYTQHALEISSIQKGILAIVKDEKPFDVFICYKESDENGKRTVDSALANDIYYQLTQEGLKVFYAAITLEDKLGQEYEPYIFAALNSSKVMLVVGTKPEYFEAVWVKNEWSRFLKIMKNDRSKLLIPCYRDMDAYDLPEEFAHLQAQDMSKIGFINDVVRGVKKVIEGSQPKTQTVKETVVVNNAGSSSNSSALLERAFMFLEDGKWTEANEYCEKVLDQNPKNAEAYLGKLMSELHVEKKDNLKNAQQPFDGLDNCIKASRFDSAIADKLKKDNQFIRERNETARKQGIYNDALGTMRSASTEKEYLEAANLFRSIITFNQAKELEKTCREKAEICRKDAIYDIAVSLKSHGKISDLADAIEEFKKIPDYKDSNEQIEICKSSIHSLKEKEEARRKAEREKQEAAAKKKKKIIKIGSPIAAALIAFIIVLNTVILPASNYKKAMAEVDAGNYENAYTLFNAHPDYKDTQEQIGLAKVKQATALLDAKKYDEAYDILEEVGDTDAINESMYNRAIDYYNSKDYESAYAIFAQITEYKDSNTKLASILKVNPKLPYKVAEEGDIVTFGNYYQSNSKSKEAIEWLVLDKQDNKLLVISKNALDSVPYNEEYESTTWEKCTLRKWLNGTFYKAAFNSSEQGMIKSTKVTADANPEYSTDPGNDTTDKVFLLSINEVNKYFSSDEARRCVPTEYAIEQGAWTTEIYKVDGKATCCWWLRSPGDSSDHAAGVIIGGGVSYGGSGVGSGDGCVRPALWIEIT